jgi:hypothetical protein
VRHATTGDFALLDDVLVVLRRLPGLTERRPGVFYRGSRAFCHFHVDEAGLFVDIRITDEFERLRVTTVAERRRFATLARAATSPANVGGAKRSKRNQ